MIEINIKELVIIFLAILVIYLTMFGYSMEIDSSNNKLDQNEENNLVYEILPNGIEYSKYNIELLQEDVKVMNGDSKFLWGISKNKSGDDETRNTLYKMDKSNLRWKKVKTFDKKIKTIHINSLGDIFVSTGDSRWSDDSKNELYMSRDLGKTFEKVLDIKSGVAITWNIDSDDEGYMFLSEYGNKSIKDNPRRIYRSKNWGRDWKIVYEPEEELGYHNHIIHIDKLNKNKIYQVIGDDDKHIMMSEDRGDTWIRLEENTHPTSVIQIDDKLVYGLDGYPFGGFKIFDTNENKVIKDIKVDEIKKGSIYNMLEVNGKIYAGALSYNYQDWPGRILESNDGGNTWETILLWNKPEGFGVGFHDMVYWNGSLYIGVGAPMDNGDGDVYWGRGTIKLDI